MLGRRKNLSFGAFDDDLPIKKRKIASECFVMNAYNTFFADLSIVLGFPISFYGIATCLLDVFAAMRFYCCMLQRDDGAIIFFSLVNRSSLG